MAVKTTIRTPMPMKMRAKQFAMFDAMKGLTEAIAEKEKQHYPRRELTESRIEEIGKILSLVQTGNYIELKYYCPCGKAYRLLSDVVTKVDLYEAKIYVGGISISFSNIDSITIF